MKLKKIISAAVSATMLCASLPLSSTTVDFVKDNVIVANAAESGKCGDNVYYSLSDDGILTISGSGDMEGNIVDNSPFSSSITSVVIEDGITSIGSYAFTCGSTFEGTKWFKNKRKENPLVTVNGILIDGKTCSSDIVIPNSVTSINENAFYHCTNLVNVTIFDSVISIDA